RSRAALSVDQPGVGPRSRDRGVAVGARPPRARAHRAAGTRIRPGGIAMTMQSDVADDVLGVARTLPRPGWIVLDAIRERRFTGEGVFATRPEARSSPARARIY